MPFVSSIRSTFGPQSEKRAATKSGLTSITGGTSAPVISGGYRIHTFSTVGTSNFDISNIEGIIESGLNVEYLVVGGGGNGGNLNPPGFSISEGGGGAGGLRQGSLFISSNIYSVTVGNTQQPSTFFSITAAPGGSGLDSGPSNNGGSGSGGQSHQGFPPGVGGIGNTPIVSPSQGNNGGAGFASTGTQPERAGGGGGAGEAGISGNLTIAGRGGNGVSSGITGTLVTYAGGGGGSSRTGGYQPDTANGAGGNGGGGAGASGTAQRAGSGASATGGGGGGYTSFDVGQRAGAGFGGSGIIVIRYLI